jgi:phosphoketolase
VLTAIGGYQLEQVLKASFRLAQHDVPHSVVYMLEPGRFRSPRSEGERAHAAPADLQNDLYPDSAVARIFVTHTRPETMLGVLYPLTTGRAHTAALGYVAQGGTLTTPGMLFVNRCTWAHILAEAARVLDVPRQELLTSEEMAALDGRASPEGVII